MSMAFLPIAATASKGRASTRSKAFSSPVGNRLAAESVATATGAQAGAASPPARRGNKSRW
jgi:hypothetical protein